MLKLTKFVVPCLLATAGPLWADPAPPVADEAPSPPADPAPHVEPSTLPSIAPPAAPPVVQRSSMAIDQAARTAAVLAEVELHANARDWLPAERAVRGLLATQPGHRRGLELLAWIYEAQGQLDRELAVRELLAEGATEVAPMRDYGRALERSGDWAGALAIYRKASRVTEGVVDLNLARALARMDQRMSVEIAAGMAAKSDPGATSLVAFTGVAVPFGRAHHFTLGAWREVASNAGRDSSSSELSTALAFTGRTTHAVAGAKLGVIDRGITAAAPSGAARWLPGAFGNVGAKLLDRKLQLAAEAELGSVWHETPRAVLEGGTVDSVTTHAWGVLLAGRLVLDNGIQRRRVQLADPTSAKPTAWQTLAWTGADYALWTDYSHEAAGQVLDEDLLRPTSLADSVVIGYRHYESWTDTDSMFDARLSLADRTSSDEVSIIARKVLSHGRVAFELRAGVGRDWLRELYLARGGGSMWLKTSPRSRLSLSFDLAKESAQALTGERRSGWMTYHVDL